MIGYTSKADFYLLFRYGARANYPLRLLVISGAYLLPAGVASLRRFKQQRDMVMKKINETRSKRQGPLPLEDPRRHCVSSRLNQEELELLDSKRGKMKRGEWLRCAALDTFKKEIVVPQLNKEAWLDLAKVSSNLNQIAKQLNSNPTQTTLVAEVNTIVMELRLKLLGLDDSL